MKYEVVYAVNQIGKLYLDRNIDMLEDMEDVYKTKPTGWTAREYKYVKGYLKSCIGSLYAPPVDAMAKLAGEAFEEVKK